MYVTFHNFLLDMHILNLVMYLCPLMNSPSNFNTTHYIHRYEYWLLGSTHEDIKITRLNDHNITLLNLATSFCGPLAKLSHVLKIGGHKVNCILSRQISFKVSILYALSYFWLTFSSWELWEPCHLKSRSCPKHDYPFFF